MNLPVPMEFMAIQLSQGFKEKSLYNLFQLSVFCVYSQSDKFTSSFTIHFYCLADVRVLYSIHVAFLHPQVIL